VNFNIQYCYNVWFCLCAYCLETCFSYRKAVMLSLLSNLSQWLEYLIFTHSHPFSMQWVQLFKFVICLTQDLVQSR
jgi:hypothetical protein